MAEDAVPTNVGEILFIDHGYSLALAVHNKVG
jgi:hypothetical protein